MKHVISHSELFETTKLTVTDENIQYVQANSLGGKKKFTFEEVDAVFVSEDNVLAFQVGEKVYSVKYKPDKPKHEAAVSFLLEKVAATA